MPQQGISLVEVRGGDQRIKLRIGLDLLLDGRSYSQIAQEMTEAYKSIGVKISVN